jgi:hypothetical protein
MLRPILVVCHVGRDKWDATSASWNAYGQINQQRQIEINQQRQIDVTDYVNEVISGGGGGQITLTFFMFRLFRHPSYMTDMGSGPGLTPSGINVTIGNLVAGSLIQISSAGSATPPQLITVF